MLMISRNSRSLSESGRSAEITKMTKSAFGMKFSVNSSCSLRMEFVPGVSTILTVFSNSNGKRVTRRLSRTREPGSSPCFKILIKSVVGVGPSSRTFWPNSVLTNADLPELNSPTITSKKSSSSPSTASLIFARSPWSAPVFSRQA